MRSYKCFARRSVFGLCYRKILWPAENILKISPVNTCALSRSSQPLLESPMNAAPGFYTSGAQFAVRFQLPESFENLGRRISEKNDERHFIVHIA
jgi:hypothetical protein